MDARRLFAVHLLTALLVLVAASAGAAPKNYVFTGKFTSNHGNLYNIPLVGNTPCPGVGLSNLRIMSGPGLTGPHTVLSMTGMSMVPNPTPTMHPFSQFANGYKKDYGCAGYVPGRKLTTTGAGVGGEFVLPDHVLSKPLPGTVIRFKGPATPVKQLFTSWAITGPRKASSLFMGPPARSPNPTWINNFRKFQKNAFALQPGRVQGAMFTYCWGNPGCVNVAGGTKPLLVKYTGGGNAFGGTMSYVIASGPNPSNVAVVEAPGGPIGFGLLPQTKSQPSGRGYGVGLTSFAQSGPHWGMYQATLSGKITMVSFYLGMNFRPANNYNIGFPFTTMTVLVRHTGTVAGNKRATTLTAKGGDTVTAMGKRNISLVAGGMARAVWGPFIANLPEIAQLYMPEPGRASQLFAGVLGLLAIAASRRRAMMMSGCLRAFLIAVTAVGAGAAGAEPKHYVYTGKFTSNRGILINIPLGGVAPCGGVGLSNLRIMSGPGLTGPHTVFSMTGMSMQPNPTPTMHPFSQFANGDKKDYGCVGFNPGRKLTTTGAGVGGKFTVPTGVLRLPFPTEPVARHARNASPIIQLATDFSITGPREEPSSSGGPGTGGSTGVIAKSQWRKFRKDAFAVQPGRDGAMFTYCWGNPGCANIAGGSRPLIVKYAGGGNQFGGTMAYVIHSGPQRSSIAVGLGGPVGFALVGGTESQPTGRGYAVRRTDVVQSGPLWGMYMVGSSGRITTVDDYIGPFFPGGKNYNKGFPFTTMTVLARNTGTVAGNKRDTTLTAKGGDTVTPMGKRNLSLVAGGMARAVIGPAVSNTPEIGQLYVPEPSRPAQLFAGVLGLLAIAASRRAR